MFAIYWCDGLCDDQPERVEPIQNVPPEHQYRSRDSSSSENTYTMISKTISKAVNNENLHETCNNDDFSCLSLAANDKLGLEAIRALHQQLDDDANGNIDLSETGDFLREDLKLDSGYEKRQKAFHHNDDMHISVKELWEAWLRSEVHNWTIEQTTEWLATNVELPQYVDNFIKSKVAGAQLPRLAVNNMHYLSVLGIKDPIHKQKISLKAMDVVLFGPPKDGRHHWKDVTLMTLIIVGGIGMWYAIQQNKKFRRHLSRMNCDMEGLQSAEKNLLTVQKELEQAKIEQETVVSEKENLVKQLQKTAEAEIEMLRHELTLAEGELKDRCWSPPHGLQQWLQLTYEIENKAYMKKKLSAEKQLIQAREACEKLRKKRSSLVGAFVSTHGKSIDEVDRSIVEARTSLTEVTQELQERVHRWQEIEKLCGFPIINNNGLHTLENTLYRNNGRAFGMRGRMSSQDDLDDESSSIYAPSAGMFDSLQSSATWKEVDSSESEASKQEEDISESSRHNVNFIIGGEPSVWVEEKPLKQQSQPSSTRSISNNNIVINKPPQHTGVLPRSYSQEVAPSEPTIRPKLAFSDTTLEAKSKVLSNPSISSQFSGKPPKIKEQAVEEDVYSTDSSVIDNNDEVKKKKRKLFAFGKKSKAKE